MYLYPQFRIDANKYYVRRVRGPCGEPPHTLTEPVRMNQYILNTSFIYLEIYFFCRFQFYCQNLRNFAKEKSILCR